MSRKNIIKVNQLSIIVVAWMLAGVFISVYDHLVLAASRTNGTGSFVLSLAVNAGAGLIGALLGGSFMVFYMNEKFQDKPYKYTVLAVGLSFLSVVVVISIIKQILLGGMLPLEAVFETFRSFAADPVRLKNIMVWYVIVSITHLVLQMNSKLGNALLGSFISGKYNVPREEKKVFMFLDLNSSTTIAEKLGDERYHELLRDFFSDITDPIMEANGQIYQYVGDEVVVAWNHQDGIKQNQCIRCFFDIKQQIKLNSEKYMKRYGLIPSFKGGFHCGKVVAGEVGTLKREITYSGDVLNTTSRILGMCKNFGAEVISSGSLVAELNLGNAFSTYQLGDIKLDGKNKAISLSAIRFLS